MLLLAQDEGDGSVMTDKQVRDEAMNIFLAGHETTANALTWTLYELSRNPAVYQRLIEELDGPYPLAVIEEAMRLHPPAYMTGRQTKHEIELGGHKLPAGTIVAVNIRGIHRRADYFPDPRAFRPERMLPDAKKARPRHHYLPFGAGPRVCIGSHFALLEAELALETIVRGARIRVTARDVQPEPMVTLRPRGGMPAIIESRN